MRDRALTLLLSGALALTLGGCGGTAAEEDPASPTPTASESQPVREGKPFTLPRSEGTLHPILSQDSANLALSGLIWEGLYELDEHFVPQPVLCESYAVSEDGLTWTLRPRGGVTFSDGSPLTADEVVSSLLLAKGESSRFAGRLGNIRSVASQEGAVSIGLYAPNGNLPALLDIPIVKGESEEPLGTGPYVPQGWGEESRLEARPGWWQNKPLPVQTIELRLLPEPDDLISAFDTGDISLVTTDLTGSDTLGFRGDHEVWDYPTTTMLFVGFNCVKGACADPLVREAISRGLDRSTVASALYARHAVPATLPAHPDSELYDGALADTLAYSPQTLADILAENGWAKDGEGVWSKGRERLELKLVVNTDNSFRMSAADYLAGELTRSGVAVTVEKLAWTDYLEALEKRDFDLYLGAVALTGDFDPGALLGTGTLNYGGYRDTETESLLGTWRAAGGEQRKIAASVLYGRLAQETPFALLGFQNRSMLTQWGAVSGLTPTQQNPFHGIEYWIIGQ